MFFVEPACIVISRFLSLSDVIVVSDFICIVRVHIRTAFLIFGKDSRGWFYTASRFAICDD